jgi:hypothetical protein
MDKLIKLEQIALFGFSIFLFSHTDYAWWWFPLLILLPDISMLGYLSGPKTGAIFYNLIHHQATALLILCLGWQIGNESLYLVGIILLGHSSKDRIFGYCLKYSDAFKNTHLGWIGKAN